MVLLVSAGISYPSSESAMGWGVSSAVWAGLSHRFGSWLATAWSRMTTDDTSDGPEPPLGTSPRPVILQQASPGSRGHTRVPREGMDLNKTSFDLGSERERHCTHCIPAAT